MGRASREEWGLVLGTWGPSRDLSRGRSAGSRTSASAALGGGGGRRARMHRLSQGLGLFQWGHPQPQPLLPFPRLPACLRVPEAAGGFYKHLELETGVREAAGPLAYPSPARGPPGVQHHISTPLPPRRNPARAGATPLRPASDSRGGISGWCKQILEATEESGPAGAGIRGAVDNTPHVPALGGHGGAIDNTPLASLHWEATRPGVSWGRGLQGGPDPGCCRGTQASPITGCPPPFPRDCIVH